MSSPKNRHKAFKSKSKSSSFDETDNKSSGPFKGILSQLPPESPKLAERIKKVLIAAHYTSEAELLAKIEEEVEDRDDKSIHKFIENMFKKAKVPHETHDYSIVSSIVKTMLLESHFSVSPIGSPKSRDPMQRMLKFFTASKERMNIVVNNETVTAKGLGEALLYADANLSTREICDAIHCPMDQSEKSIPDKFHDCGPDGSTSKHFPVFSECSENKLSSLCAAILKCEAVFHKHGVFSRCCVLCPQEEDDGDVKEERNDTSWFVLMKFNHDNGLPTEGTTRYTTYIFKLKDVHQCYEIWHHLHYVGKKMPNWYYVSSAGNLISLLNSFNLNWTHCVITVIGLSRSTVYQVTTEFSGKKVSFVVKLNPNTDRHNVEVDALFALGQAYTENNKQLYAVASVSCDGGGGESVIYFQEDRPCVVQTMLQSYDREMSGLDEETWLTSSGEEAAHPPVSVSKEYNALLMYVGEPVRALSGQLYDDIITSLSLMQSAGIVHTDIRNTANMMYFPDLKEYQLIDFDLSCKVGEVIPVDLNNERGKASPHRIKRLIHAKGAGVTKGEVRWTFVDDVCMFTEYLMSVGFSP